MCVGIQAVGRWYCIVAAGGLMVFKESAGRCHAFG